MRKLLLVIFVIFGNFAKGQEVFLNLQTNAVLQSYSTNKNTKRTETSKTNLLELPFLDDFSFSVLFPSNSLWLDSAVFVNNSYGTNLPTVGVATFDAIDKNGKLHKNVIPNVTRLADVLTSKPLDLYYPNDMSVFLSFYYQPQGEADAPESTDTLMVEFFSPVTSKWVTVWKAICLGSSVKEIYPSSEKVWKPETAINKSFKHVILPILGSNYLQEGFQFRFKNFVSINGLIPSKIGNGDFWNIDYVYLNKGRNELDSVRTDIAFIQPTQSLLADYESVPWRHYVNNPQAVKMKEYMTINYRNNDNRTRTIDSLYITFKDTLKHTNASKLEASASNIGAYVEMKPELPIGGYAFPVHSDNKAVFEIQVKLVTSSSFDPISNNKTAYYQQFYNYYAYDDGVPELGYGISGSGTKNAMLAYKFTSYIADTLRFVDMYFNQTYNNESQKYFDLTIWDDNNGLPGSIIYRQQGVKPEYQANLNQFYSYPIADTSNLVLSGTYYIGWIQTAEALLNIGYDINRNAQNKIFYNIDGSWQGSAREGALLLRPVFRKELLTSIANNLENNEGLIVYPNPASQYIQLKFDNLEENEMDVLLLDITGKLVFATKNYQQDELIPVSELQKGIYILKLKMPTKTITRKIVIN